MAGFGMAGLTAGVALWIAPPVVTSAATMTSPSASWNFSPAWPAALWEFRGNTFLRVRASFDTRSLAVSEKKPQNVSFFCVAVPLTWKGSLRGSEFQLSANLRRVLWWRPA
jgi:hypothetical protein